MSAAGLQTDDGSRPIADVGRRIANGIGMKVFSIIVGLALSGCGVSNFPGATEAAAKTAVQREFGSDAEIVSPVLNSAGKRVAMCGFVATAEPTLIPTAAFIWTAGRLEVSRWNDSQYAGFDRRAREICGPHWVAPMRVPAVS